MPWTIHRDNRCPLSKPFAVVKSADGEVVGCHETREKALKQQAALYANEKEK